MGIVGRTGAGKSSLLVTLLRLVELKDGQIRIDGRPTSSVGLHALRCRIAIIPQEPVLFSGTLRFNLDPFERHTSDKLWATLADAKLKEFVESRSGGPPSPPFPRPHPHGGGRLLAPGTRLPPPPLRALRAHLVTKGQWLLAIHRVAPKAPENFFSFPLPT